MPVDMTVALRLICESADQDNPWAYDSLGAAYLQGEGVPQDYVQAYKWYGLTAARFEALGSKHHGQAVSRLQSVADKLTAAERAVAQEFANDGTPSALQ